MKRLTVSAALLAMVLAGCGGTAATTTTTAAAPSSTTTTSTPVATTTTTVAVVAPEPETTTTTTTQAPAAVDIDIAIVGDENFVEQASAALGQLDAEAPEALAEVLMHISTIESVTAGSGMDVFTKTFRVGDVTAYAPGYQQPDQVVWLAGTIVHDACHSRLYTDGEEYIGRDAELACLQDQAAVLLLLTGFAFENYVQSLVDGVDEPGNDYWNDENRHW